MSRHRIERFFTQRSFFMAWRRLFFSTLVSFLVSAWALGGEVRAQGSEGMAKGHYASGKSYYQQGRYRDAIREFKAALRLSEKPGLYYNIALCWERLGNLQKAIEYRRKYLKALPNASDAQQVKLQIASLKERLRATSVVLKGGPAGAEVRLDGKSMGKLPLKEPISVRPGSHKIVVTKPGYERFKSVVGVSAGQSLEVQVEMEKKERALPPPRRPVARPRKPPRPRPEGLSTKGKPEPPPKEKKRKRLWTWVSLGVGAGILAGGVVAGALASHWVDEANKSLDRGDMTGYDDNESQAKAAAITADISYALGGALVVTGVVLYFLEDRSSEEPAAKARIITPYADGTSIGIAAGGTF
jgi:tetratricopeptide (TPR) repeat protein